MKLKPTKKPTYKVADIVYDKTSRRKAVVEKIELYKNTPGYWWYVIRFFGKNSCFVRNAHPEELRKV